VEITEQQERERLQREAENERRKILQRFDSFAVDSENQ